MMNSTSFLVDNYAIETENSIGITLSFKPFEILSLSDVYLSRKSIVNQFLKNISSTCFELKTVTHIENNAIIVLFDLGDGNLTTINKMLLSLSSFAKEKGQDLSFSIKPVFTHFSWGDSADTAKYLSKNISRNSLLSTFGSLNEIDYIHALINKEFIVYGQRLMNIDSGTVRGVELLCRWDHPIMGVIYPDNFLPGIEACNLQVALDSYILSEAVKILCTWQDTVKCNLKLSVNMFSSTLASAEMVEKLVSIAYLHPEIVCKLTIEITETSVIEVSSASHENIVKIQSLGFAISIDDLGCGTSNIGYLSYLSPKEIKLDRSLINAAFFGNVEYRSIAMSILKSIIDLVLDMDGVELIVEGIETVEQLEYLKSLGVSIGQGYIYGKPVSLTELEVLYLNA